MQTINICIPEEEADEHGKEDLLPAHDGIETDP
jgi:hypothetical protein